MEKDDGGQWSPCCPPAPQPCQPPSASGMGKPYPAPLHALSQVVFSFLLFSLSPVAKDPKPTSAEDAPVFGFANHMQLYIHFHHRHLLWLVPGISYLRHQSVPITDSDEHSIFLWLTLCLSSLHPTGESLSLLPLAPHVCAAGLWQHDVQRENKEIWGKEWILARVTRKPETLVSCLCLQDKAAEVSRSQVETEHYFSPFPRCFTRSTAGRSRRGWWPRLGDTRLSWPGTSRSQPAAPHSCHPTLLRHGLLLCHPESEQRC